MTADQTPVWIDCSGLDRGSIKQQPWYVGDDFWEDQMREALYFPKQEILDKLKSKETE